MVVPRLLAPHEPAPHGWFSSIDDADGEADGGDAARFTDHGTVTVRAPKRARCVSPLSAAALSDCASLSSADGAQSESGELSSDDSSVGYATPRRTSAGDCCDLNHDKEDDFDGGCDLDGLFGHVFTGSGGLFATPAWQGGLFDSPAGFGGVSLMGTSLMEAPDVGFGVGL